MYKILVKFLEKKILSCKGLVMSSDDTFEAETEKYKIYVELEKRIPGTRYSADILMDITNNQTGKTKRFAVEYDCLQWHRKWKDEKKNDMFVENNINVVRIQTFSQMPNSKILWHFITEIYNSDDEPKIMYYQLPDYIEDIWTGKLFLYYR